MAANTEWIAGDELDVLDQLLLDDDLFDDEVKSSIEQMPKEDKTFPCLMCSKICLSSGGLKRHISTIHKDVVDTNAASSSTSSSSSATTTKSSSSTQKKKKVEDILHPGYLKKMILASLEKVKVDECYPPHILLQFSNFSVNSVEDVFPCYHAVADSIVKFKGDLEKFYPTFYSSVSSNDVFPGLPKECQLILGFELANHVVAFLSGARFEQEVVSFEEKVFTPKEKAIISYISGYIIGKFYRKLRFGKNKNEYQEHCLSILETCKYLEGSETDAEHLKLIDAKDRGGLWRVNANTIAIFSIAECLFQNNTKHFVTKIDVSEMVSELLSDAPLVAYFNNMRARSELHVKKEVALNLLEDMLSLYLRIRSHSYAKNKQQNFKVNKDATRAKSLRTERKRENPTLESGH